MADSESVEVTGFRRGRPEGKREERRLVVERPLRIEVRDGTAYTIMRTPGADRELTVGFLFSEGLIRSKDDILILEECPEDPDTIRVRLAEPDAKGAKRSLVVSSSCGLCGRDDIEALVADLPPAPAGPQFPLQELYELPERVRAGQEIFQTTGGSHAAALFDANGRVLVLREDLGRHNALDKVLGHALLSEIPTAGLGVFISGRTSLEMIVKAARAGIGLVAAVSAPTDAAVGAARRLGMALCGFVRGEEVTAYTHPERLAGG